MNPGAHGQRPSQAEESPLLSQPLGALLEAAPDAMLVIDSEGRIDHVNKLVEELFGYQREELINRSMEMLLPERFRGAHPRHRQRYQVEPRKRPMGRAGVELFGRRKDGSEFPAEVSLSPVEFEGRVLVIAAIRDGTPRRQVEARFRRLVEAAPDAMVLTNRAGEIVLVNQQAEHLFGYERDELLLRPASMLLPEHSRSQAGEPGHPFAPSEGERSVHGVRKDGSEFPAEVGARSLGNEGVTGGSDDPVALLVIRDVSERRRAEAERTKLVQAQEAIRLRDEFLSIASHELRTPLTPIQLQIDGALRAARRHGDGDHETVVRKLEALSSGIHRLSTLVNQLLDLSRINAGRLDLERSKVDLVALVRRALAAFEDEAQRNECSLELEAPRGELRGHWDSSRLEQVVTNLLSNALRYGTGRPVAISLIEPEPGKVMLLVRDQGVGIAPEHQALVFQRFERVSEARHKGGFGLGLWIVRQIVDAHGGVISVFSRPGLGATFAVELPTGLEPRAREDVVLLIDDDLATREAFRAAAEGAPYRALTAGHGADALGLLHFGIRPALILLDDDMPFMDGAAFVAELATRPELCDVPVVWLGERDGAACLRKPFTPADLDAVVGRHRRKI